MQRNSFTEDVLNFLQSIASECKINEEKENRQYPLPPSQYIQNMLDSISKLSDAEITQELKGGGQSSLTEVLLKLLHNLGPDDEEVITEEQINRLLSDHKDCIAPITESADYEGLNFYVTGTIRPTPTLIFHQIPSNSELHTSLVTFFNQQNIQLSTPSNNNAPEVPKINKTP